MRPIYTLSFLWFTLLLSGCKKVDELPSPFNKLPCKLRTYDIETLTAGIEYDSKGRIQSSYFLQSRANVSKAEYNKQGRMIKLKFPNSNNLNPVGFYYEYEYNSLGMPITIGTWRIDPNPVNAAKGIFNQTERINLEYDVNGNLIKRSYYYDPNNTGTPYLGWYVVNQYDGRGNISTSKQYSNNNLLTSLSEFEYDDKINAFLPVLYVNPNYFTFHRFIFNRNNATKQINKNADGSIDSITIFAYEYNAQGVPTKQMVDIEYPYPGHFTDYVMHYTYDCQ